MSNSPSPREFEMHLPIAAGPDAVWRALVDPGELCRWFPPEARVEPRPGGEVVWRWGDFHTWTQRIEVLEPGKHLRTRHDSGVPDGAGGQHLLFLDFFLQGERGRTTLRLVHSGFGPDAAFDDEFDGISSGWPVELRSLRLYLERHAGRDRQLAWSIAPISIDAGEAWRRLVGRDGLACGAGLDRLREGEAFALRTATGDAFEGRCLFNQPRHFCGVARSHGDAFLRVAVERCGGAGQVWLWLATYGQPEGQSAALQARWDDMLARLFAPAGAAAEASEGR